MDTVDLDHWDSYVLPVTHLTVSIVYPQVTKHSWVWKDHTMVSIRPREPSFTQPRQLHSD